MIRLADGGDAARLKVLEGVTVNPELVLTAVVPLVSVIAPVADPAATTNVREVCDALAIGSPMVQPRCFAMDTCAAEPKSFPVTVTEVPIGPDCGLKPEIDTTALPQPNPRAALISIWTSTTLSTPSLFRSLFGGFTPRASLTTVCTSETL